MKILRGYVLVFAFGTVGSGISATGIAAEQVLPNNQTHAPMLDDGSQLVAFKKAIRLQYDLKENSWAAHDADAIIANFYAVNAIEAGAAGDVSVGRDQIKPGLAEAVNSGTVKIRSVYTFVAGDAGWDWTDFALYSADKKVKEGALTVLFLWARIQGQWRCMGEFGGTYVAAGNLMPNTTDLPVPRPH